MAVRNTAVSYGSVARFFHWLVALLVVGQLLGGFYAADFAEQSMKGLLFFWHKSLGLTILWLMLLRVIWRFKNIQPGYEARVPLWQRFAARLVHLFLYLLLLGLPINGWILSTAAGYPPSYFGLFTVGFPGIPVDKALAETMSSVHEILAWIIIGLVTLHILAALKHHFIHRDNVLRRMWSGQ